MADASAPFAPVDLVIDDLSVSRTLWSMRKEESGGLIVS